MFDCSDRLLDALRRDPCLLRESFRLVESAVTSKSKTIYNDRTQFFLLPMLVMESTWHAVKRDMALLVSIVKFEVDRRLQGDRFSGALELGLSPSEAELICRTGSFAGEALARPDCMITKDGPAFLEANVDSSLGGLGTADDLADVYLDSPYLGGLLRELGARHEPIIPELARLLGSYASGRHGLVAIVDWRDEIDEVPWPYERLIERLDKAGVRAILANEDELEFDRNLFSVRGQAVSVVFRGITPGPRFKDEHRRFDPLWAAASHGCVALCSSLDAMLYGSKIALAWVSEAAEERLLDDDKRAFAARCVPWTRVLRDCSVSRGGTNVDLAAMCLSEQAELVIKGAYDYSSRSVIIGRETSESEWRSAVSKALTEKSWVVQQFVPPPRVRQPVLTADGLDVIDFNANIASFVIGGAAFGSCLRGLPSDEHLRISCALGAREGVIFPVKVAA
jgi:hypothetical protein